MMTSTTLPAGAHAKPLGQTISYHFAAIGGSWLADKKPIAAKDWTGITKNAREAVALASTK